MEETKEPENGDHRPEKLILTSPVRIFKQLSDIQRTQSPTRKPSF